MRTTATPRWHHVAGRPVRSLGYGAAGGDVPHLVAVPGLGAPGYLLPTAARCAAWARVDVLDVPGFGHRLTARCPSTLDDVVAAVGGWLRARPAPAPVLLVGHSTGAQAAARVAAAFPDLLGGVVLAGITFPPALRRWRPLVAATARTLAHERPGELAATLPSYARGGSRVPVLLRSAMADAPEAVLPRLACPVTVVRGARDHLCPAGWAAELAASAPDGAAVTLPGAHNVPYTHPAEMAAVLREAAGATHEPGRSTGSPVTTLGEGAPRTAG